MSMRRICASLLFMVINITYGDVNYVSGNGNDVWDGQASEWNGIHGPKVTIQSAIDAAVDGDEVIIYPGTYTGAGNVDLNYNGKAITVRSIAPNDKYVISSTVIDCNGTAQSPARGFIFANNEENNSILNGLTITRGYAPDSNGARLGGAIYCAAGSPSILNCIFESNIMDISTYTVGGQ